MKVFLPFLVAALLGIATASADWVIESKSVSGSKEWTTVTRIKGQKVRVDTSDGFLRGPTSAIIDGATGDSIMLVHEQKVVVKRSAAQLKQTMGEGAKSPAGAKGGAAGVKRGATPRYHATGQREKVGEYDCEIYTLKTGTNVSRYWVARNHPLAAALIAAEKLTTQHFDAGGMPDPGTLPGAVLKWEFGGEGKKSSETVISVKEQPVNASEFEVPPDYRPPPPPGAPPGVR